MFAKFFDTPTDRGLQQFFIFATDSILSYRYTERWTNTGSFTVTLPFNAKMLQKIRINQIINIEDDWLLIQEIQYDGRIITISGTDCKGLLGLRISVFGETQVAGADGYDVVSGTTKECVRHYLDRNLISPTDSERAMPIDFSNAASVPDGLTNDSYMARLEDLSDIVGKLCDNAGLGYTIKGYKNYESDYVLRFTLLAGTDRSAQQNARPRVIFSPAWGNVLELSFDHDVGNLYNAIYATGANTTQPIYRSSSIPTGLSRRECSVEVSADTVDELEMFALYQVQDNTESHTYTLSAAASSGYGTKYFLGDIVSVKDDYTGNVFSDVITEVEKSVSNNARSIVLTLGRQKPKLLNRIIQNMINGTTRER